MPRYLLFFKANQADLFSTPVPIKGHTRKDGQFVKPHLARRRKRSQPPAPTPAPAPPPLQGDALIQAALVELQGRLKQPGQAFTNPDSVKQFLQFQLAQQQSEAFSVLFLDNKHRMLAFETLFHGTINGSSVHPREVVKRALAHNAAAVILAHNHPSGVAEPSQADRLITEKLRTLLGAIDVQVLDHIIIGGDASLETSSFAERGLL